MAMQGRGNAINVLCVLASSLLATLLLQTGAEAKNHNVGGALNWDYPPPADSDYYDKWSTQQTFLPGDTLTFTYAAGAHDTTVVTAAEYAGCGFSTGKKYTTGSDVVTLPKAGTYYFYCSFIGHCESGMKLKVVVASAVTPVVAPVVAPVVPPVVAPVVPPVVAPVVPPVVAPAPVPVRAPVPSPVPVLAPAPVPVRSPVPSPVPVLAPAPVPVRSPVPSPVPVLAPVPVPSPTELAPAPAATTPTPVIVPGPAAAPSPGVSSAVSLAVGLHLLVALGMAAAVFVV